MFEQVHLNIQSYYIYGIASKRDISLNIVLMIRFVHLRSTKHL